MQAQEAVARRKPGRVRDFLLNEALKRLATEAATRLSTLVADGEADPLRRRRRSGRDSAFYSYVPLTGRYVDEQAEELRSLPELRRRPARPRSRPASPPLTSRPAASRSPADPGARAERMLIVFFA